MIRDKYYTMKLYELFEGRVKNAYMSGTYFNSKTATSPVSKMYKVLINHRHWKDFEDKVSAERAANAVYNKNPKLRVDVLPY